MPTLIVKPLDMTAPGSYAARRRIRGALRDVRDAYNRMEQVQAQQRALTQSAAAGDRDAAAAADAFDRELLDLTGRITGAMDSLEDMVIAQARTDDGSPVEAVLDTISAKDFDVLLEALLGKAPVPQPSSGN